MAQRVASGTHGDLRVVERRAHEKTGKLRAEIVVEDVRAVGRFMSMTAMEGGWRVVIIDAAEDMNRNAANALLKVLEEPPEIRFDAGRTRAGTFAANHSVALPDIEPIAS